MPYFDQFGAQDTSPESQRIWTEHLKSKTPEEKLQLIMDLNEFSRNLRLSTRHLRKAASNLLEYWEDINGDFHGDRPDRFRKTSEIELALRAMPVPADVNG